MRDPSTTLRRSHTKNTANFQSKLACAIQAALPSGSAFSQTSTTVQSNPGTITPTSGQRDGGHPSDALDHQRGAGFVVISDKFTSVHSIEEMRDLLNFDGDKVGIGQSVTLHFAITDCTNDHHTHVPTVGNA